MTEPQSTADIRSQVYALIAEQAKIDVATIQDTSTLKDLGVASLDAIELIFEIEERFDIHFPDQGADFDSDTVRDLIEAVAAAQSAGGEGEVS